MHVLPFETSHDADGPIHTLTPAKGSVIQFVPERHFARRAQDFDCQRRGNFYRVGRTNGIGARAILVSNAAPPVIARLDRDETWHRRLELATLLPEMLMGMPSIEPGVVRTRLPLSLLAPSLLETFPAGATASDVFAACFRNTQRHFNTLTTAIHAGQRHYDVERYARCGVGHTAYSHLSHFAWIYARQIALIDELLATYPHRTLTVVDVGTGAGHFLLTLANHLIASGMESRVRLVGIDGADDDMAFVRGEFTELAVDAQFLAQDVTGVNFADSLRKHRPDVVIANHVIEHLPGDVKNRYLQDWLLAARHVLSISVPLGDEPERSISEHVAAYSVDAVAELATSIELRVGHAVRARDVEHTKLGGLCSWSRTNVVADWGGFSCTSVSVAPSAIALSPDPLLEDFAKPFDPNEFSKVRRAPKIGEVQDRRRFAEIGQPRQVRHLLIKTPGSDVRLPGELAKFDEAVQIIISHNRAANADYERSFAYLNVFQGTTLFSSYRGLSLSCHGDQLQSLRTECAYRPDWSYIVSSALPTILYEQGFDVMDAVRRAKAGEAVNLYDYLNAQAREANVYRSDNFGIYLLSPYVVHSAAIADADIERVFMKVAFSTKRFFDNRELRRNPAFDIEDWYAKDTVGYIDGWLSHAHWNERFLKADLLSRTFLEPRRGAQQ